MEELIKHLKELKTAYEQPNNNDGSHNYGAVEALNKAIAKAEKISPLEGVSGNEIPDACTEEYEGHICQDCVFFSRKTVHHHGGHYSPTAESRFCDMGYWDEDL